MLPNDIYLLHWIAALTADSPPRFEILVEPKGDWTPPAPTPDFAVVPKGRSMTALGPVANTGGWHAWWAARWVAAALAGIPEGSSIDVAMAPRLDYDADLDPAVGRALYSGTVQGGLFEITHASPRITRDTLASAVAFVRDLAVDGRMTVRPGPSAKRSTRRTRCSAGVRTGRVGRRRRAPCGGGRAQSAHARQRGVPRPVR
jgi:hypothetical protein